MQQLYDELAALRRRVAELEEVLSRGGPPAEQQRALWASEARYRTLFEQANDAIFVNNEEDDILDVNRRACELLGYSREELLSMKVPDLQAPEVRGRPGTVIKEELRRSTAGLIEAVDLHRDGRRIPVEVSTTRLSSAGQGLTLSIVRDISERKRTAEALRRHAEQLEALRQVGLEIAAQLDLDSLLQSIVARAIDLLGARSGGFYLYRPGPEVLEWSVAAGPGLVPVGATLTRGEGLSGKVWQTGQPLVVNDYSTWSGQADQYQNYNFGAVIGVPVRWGDEFLGVLNLLAEPPKAFAPEDTELLMLLAAQAASAIKNAWLFRAEQRRRREAEALRQASLALGSTLDTEQVLEHLLDQIGTVVPYDSANVMWIEQGVARVTHIRGYQRPGSEEAMAALRLPVADVPNLAQMVTNGRPYVVPNTWADPGWQHLEVAAWIRSWVGAPIVVSGEVVALFSLDSGRPGFYSAEHAELLAAFAAHASLAIENARLFGQAQAAYEELKQTQAQLLQSAKLAAIGELAAGVAHELNNPLTSILGFAELLAWGLAADDPVREDAETIVQEAKRARDIVRALVNFARQPESFSERADLNQIVRETLDLLRRQAEVRGVRLVESYARDLPLLYIVAGRMKQVFLNLIGNALQAMPQGGELAVRSERRGEEVVVHVADTGTGILPEHLDHVFEPFFTTKPVGQGTGLGLSISLSIVQAHEGRMTVESQPGRGSTFSVWLPLSRAEAPRDP